MPPSKRMLQIKRLAVNRKANTLALKLARAEAEATEGMAVKEEPATIAPPFTIPEDADAVALIVKYRNSQDPVRNLVCLQVLVEQELARLRPDTKTGTKVEM
jgi:hypothetical protein